MLDRVVIESTKAASAFSNGRQRKILLTLIEHEHSLSELARLTETPLNLLHHHIRRFTELALVSITREEARAGRPIKFYRATAREFFVPAELLATLPGEGLNLRLRAALDNARSKLVEGVSYDVADGHPRMRAINSPGADTGSAELWLELGLNSVDAAALSRELSELLHKFKLRASERGRRYLVHAALAPIDKRFSE